MFAEPVTVVPFCTKVAVMTAVPVEIPFTEPYEVTMATAALDDVQVA